MKNHHFEIGGIYERADGLRIEILEKFECQTLRMPGLVFRIISSPDGKKYHDRPRRGYPVSVTHRVLGPEGVVKEIYNADVLTRSPHGDLRSRSLGIRADIHKVQ